MNEEATVYNDPWSHLRKYTKARIALGRAGVSLTTAELLRFRMDHARARDAVLQDMDQVAVRTALGKYGLPVVELATRARNRGEFILRPDLGRKLSSESAALLTPYQGAFDVSLVIADGLSGRAIETNIEPFFGILLPLLRAERYTLSPLTIVRQGRVAIADEIGGMFKARLSVIMIGERPGLSSADSMGIYLTYGPGPGLTDDRRNCISNIRPEGLACSAAAFKLLYYIRESLHLKLSGVRLKDSEKDSQVRFPPYP